MNVLSVSYGNDSFAMLQWARESGLDDVFAVYIETGWAAASWADRVSEGESFARNCGFTPITIRPELQFEELIRSKKGFPNQRYQWCSAMLKGLPFLNWIDEIDPECQAAVFVGKRRSESRARADTPCIIWSSDYHGGRMLVHPLYRHDDAERDALLKRAGIKPLPHRSLECDPCVNANRADFRRLDWVDIEKVALLETAIGKTMFRPAKHAGAKGISEVVHWAKYSAGQYDPSQADLFNEGCGSPFGCGI